MAKQKKTPMRKSVGCRQMFPKKELLRIVSNENGSLELDSTGKKNGRGAYICAKSDCLRQAVKQRQLQRALESELTEETINDLEIQIMRREANFGNK